MTEKNFRKSSQISENVRKFPEIFGNVRKFPQKNRSVQALIKILNWNFIISGYKHEKDEMNQVIESSSS